MTGSPVALFLPNLETGGAERVIVVLANAFARKGCAVDLVLQQAKGPLLAELDPRVKVVDLKASRLLYCAWPLFRYLREARPQALLATLVDANIVAAAAWKVSRLCGPLILREAITASIHDAVDRGVRARVIALIRRMAYRGARWIVAPSKGVAEDLVSAIGIDASRVIVVPNPVDVNQLVALASAGDDVLTGSDAPVVLAVGRLAPQKDFATLLHAFSVVRRVRKSVLVILGEGEEREALASLASELQISDAVLMPGFVPNPFSYMRRAAVFVLSSRYEGLPNALLQAVALGLPAVSTDCPSGPREILDGGRWGRLVPVGDAESMASAIVEALDGSLDAPPSSYIEERFGVEVVSRRYMELLVPTACRPASPDAIG